MNTDKRQQDKAADSKKDTLTNQKDSNPTPQADGFRYDYDDSSDVK